MSSLPRSRGDTTGKRGRVKNPEYDRLAALRLVQPDAFRAEIRTALQAHGSIPAAAEALGVSRSAVERWLREAPAIREGLELPGRGYHAQIRNRTKGA